MDVNDSLLDKTDGQKFKTILADCPWPSGKPKSSSRDNWIKTNMKPRYGTMTAEQIMSLPVSFIADKDAVLVMWATWMHLGLAMETISRWGFRYCAGFPWLKVVTTGMEPKNNIEISDIQIQGMKKKFKAIPAPIYGPGVWAQGCTEPILIARRGRPFGNMGNPRPARKGLIIAPRQEHSRKPEELQKWIDDNFPSPCIELFARRTRPGWTVWGNEVVDGG